VINVVGVKEEKMPTTYHKHFTEYTEKELCVMTREEACLTLNDKQRKWCEIYVNNFNSKIAAKRAGYTSESAHSLGWKLRQRDDVNLYLAWLKLRISFKMSVRPEDIIDQYARIAFADITDFVTTTGNSLKLANSDMIDGQLVKSIRRGKDGISIEMYDKFQALSRLERFFDEMPKDWKQKLEERKLQIMEKKLEIEQQRAGLGDDEDEDDGFLEALRGTVNESWDDDL
jgi:phage terminase small subunit